MKGVAEPGDELAAKDAAEHADGKKEGTPSGDPAGMIRDRRRKVRSGYADETVAAGSSCEAHVFADPRKSTPLFVMNVESPSRIVVFSCQSFCPVRPR